MTFLQTSRQRRLLTIAITFVFYSVIVGALLVRNFHGNPSGFICLGSKFIPFHIQNNLSLLVQQGDGYDGQFFFYMARDLFGGDNLNGSIDHPRYRFGRILYPALARTLILGSAEGLPVMLLLINLAAVMGTAWLAAQLFEQEGISALWALLLVLGPGMLLPVVRDLAEPTMMFFLVAGYFYLVRSRIFSAAACLAAASLAREVALVAVVAFVLEAIVNRQRRTALVLLMPLAVAGAWQVVVLHKLSALLPAQRLDNLGWPLEGAAAHFLEIFKSYGEGRALGLKNVGTLLLDSGFLLAAILSVAAAVKFLRGGLNVTSFSLLCYGALCLCLAVSLWQDPWNYLRTLGLVTFFLILCHAKRPTRSSRLCLGVSIALALLAIPFAIMTTPRF